VNTHHDLQAGESVRVADVLASDFKLKAAVGVVIVDSPGADGLFPVVLGETYTLGASVYGQSVPALDDRDVANTGQTQVLLGLRADGAYRTTLWLYNPSASDAGTVELTYRQLDGSQLGKVTFSVAAGKAYQFAARASSSLPKVLGYFTVEARVTKG